MSTGGGEARVIEGYGESVAIFRRIDVCVVAIMRNELMVFGEWDADKKFEGCFHDYKVKEEVEDS